MANAKTFKNGIPVYCGKIVDFNVMGIEKALQTYEKNRELLMEIDKQAKEKGELLGRYVAVPIADGQAYYQIVRVNKNTVRIKLVENIGDDYMVDYFGYEATIDKEYATDNVGYRDRLDAIFS